MLCEPFDLIEVFSTFALEPEPFCADFAETAGVFDFATGAGAAEGFVPFDAWPKGLPFGDCAAEALAFAVDVFAGAAFGFKDDPPFFEARDFPAPADFADCAFVGLELAFDVFPIEAV